MNDAGHMTEPCIARAIWTRALADHPNTNTAQQRQALDTTLRAETAKIEDPGLRAHAVEIIRALRREKFECEFYAPLLRRLQRIEKALGIDDHEPREIHSIKPEDAA